MSLNTAATFNALESHLLASGLFSKVNTAEPKSAPPDPGLVAAVWVDRVFPSPADSGLQKTTAVVVYIARIYSNMLAEPTDAIDPEVLTATDTVLTSLSGDFELGGNARNVDLLGQTGVQLSAQAGYINQDNKLYRVMDITIPVIINDAWSQSP